MQIVLALFSSFLVDSMIAFMPIESMPLKILYFLNATLSMVFLFSYKEQPYNLHKIVNLFILIFFVMANAIQCANKTTVTSIPIRFNTNDYVEFQFLTMIILIVFNLFYAYYFKYLTMGRGSDYNYIISSKLLLIISIISTIIVFVYHRNGLLLLFVRGLIEFEAEDDMEGDEEEGNAGTLIIGKVIRALPFVCYLISLNYNIAKKYKRVLFCLMLLTVFPLGIARNAIGMYWLPVIFMQFKVVEKKNFFVLAMIIGLLVFFPIMGNFRRWSGSFQFDAPLDYLNTLNFDASQEFMVVLNKNIVTYGNQLLGVLGFWIPRSLWEAKPVGSGFFIADKYDAFGNISMPFFAEGYINFGIIGLFLFILLLSWFCSKCDKFYWSNNVNHSFKPLYLVLIGSFLFILRGDLLSSFSYTLATILDIYFVLFMVKKQTCLKCAAN